MYTIYLSIYLFIYFIYLFVLCIHPWFPPQVCPFEQPPDGPPEKTPAQAGGRAAQCRLSAYATSHAGYRWTHKVAQVGNVGKTNWLVVSTLWKILVNGKDYPIHYGK